MPKVLPELVMVPASEEDAGTSVEPDTQGLVSLEYWVFFKLLFKLGQ